MAQDRVQALLERVQALEAAWGVEDANAAEPRESWTEQRRRVVTACEESGVVARMVRVPQGYYGKGLQERAELVGAPSVHHLCKSVLFKNTAWESSGDASRENAEYYLVVVQYTAKVDSEMLCACVRALLPEGERRPKNKYAFRLATSEESASVAGFEHNAVAPLGLADKNVPLLVSKAVTELNPPVAWLGGGEVDLKLQVNVSQFCSKTGAFVASISVPRDPSEFADVLRDDSVANASACAAAPDIAAQAALFDQLDLRVGVIVAAENHPGSDKLLVEQIDVGDAAPGEEAQTRQILSGIAAHYAPQDLIGKRVAVLCNLKAAKLAGLASNGMVMCAVSAGHSALRVVEPPSNAPVGARIALLGAPAQDAPASSAQIKKKKILEGLLPLLALNSNFQATFDGCPWTVPGCGGDPGDAVCTAAPLPLPASVS